MEDLKKLKRIRGGLKAGVTKLSKDLAGFLSAANVREKQAKLTTIQTTQAKIQMNNEKIYEFMDDEELQSHGGGYSI